MHNKTIHLLSTRPLDEGLLLHAAANDIIIDTASFIQTTPVEDIGLQQQVVALSRQPLAVVFTSMNAAEAVAAWLNGRQPQWTIFSLGTATSQVVKSRFGIEPAGQAANNASALADEIIRSNTGEVVFFCGDRRRDELPEKLIAHNIRVEEMVVYTTISLPKEITSSYDGILFFSPSAVESFFAVNNVPSGTVLFAIGDTTAESLGRQCGNPVVVSDLPGKTNLVEKAVTYFNHFKQINEPVQE